MQNKVPDKIIIATIQIAEVSKSNEFHLVKNRPVKSSDLLKWLCMGHCQGTGQNHTTATAITFLALVITSNHRS